MVSWYLTYKCNYNCIYCDIPRLYSGEELDTVQIFRIIDELNTMGVGIISFCGGEPLLRDDLAEIINYCGFKDIDVQIISNGSLVPEKIEWLRNLHMLKLSFDGPDFIHDKLRGVGSYKAVMEAVTAAKKYKTKAVFNTTLSRLNLPYIEFIINKSRELEVPVIFSPLKYNHAGNKDIEELMPRPGFYKEKIKYLIGEAKRNKHIINSLAVLRYLELYPEGRQFKSCIAGRIFCHISPNGDMHPCVLTAIKNPPNCIKDGVEKSFRLLPLCGCSHCWCVGALEVNMVYSFSPSALFKVMQRGF